MLHFAKNASLSPDFLPFLSACGAKKTSNLAFRTTGVEDAQLTLAVIPFQVGANNSLIFLPLQTYEKKFAEFPFLKI